MRGAVDAQTFDIWLAPLCAVELQDQLVVLAAPDTTRQWIANRFGPLLDSAAAAVLGDGFTVTVLDASSAWDGAPRPQHPTLSADVGDDEPLHPKLVFEQFVIGSSNRFAHAAALAVAELPGHAYNPLFIYGPPGVGKTHLLHSIGNYARAYGGGITVRATTAERFTGEFVGALQRGDLERFKARFRRADVLLVDDVQFLQSKARTEEEFFHTFNALHDCGAQLVLTSDRLPRDLGALEDRLRARFEAGLVTDISAPDEAVRLAVLHKRVHHDGIVLADPAALDAIAERVTQSLRALEAALVRVVAFHSLTGRPIDAALAVEVLDGLGLGAPASRARRTAPPTVEHILHVTCAEFGITRDEILSPSRLPHIAGPRQIAMHLARAHTAESLPAIARHFGGRDHTTIMRASRRVDQRLASDPDICEVVRRLTERLVRDR